MDERLHAIWVLITAPFPLFLIVLIIGGTAYTAWRERGE